MKTLIEGLKKLSECTLNKYMLPASRQPTDNFVAFKGQFFSPFQYDIVDKGRTAVGAIVKSRITLSQQIGQVSMRYGRFIQPGSGFGGDKVDFRKPDDLYIIRVCIGGIREFIDI